MMFKKNNNCSDKQAFAIYYEIYGDVKDKADGLYKPDKNQEIMRLELFKKNKWNENEMMVHLVDKIQKKLTGKQAYYVLNLLKTKKDWAKAQKILTQ